jgi:hypothetical protein
MQRLRWWFPRPPRRQCVAGLDLGVEGAWLVVLEGSLESAEHCACVEQLRLPDGLVQGPYVVDPLALGQWLKAWFKSRGWVPQGLCLALEDVWLRRQTVALPAQLSDRDVAFQLAAELAQTQDTDPTQVCWTYQVVSPTQGVHSVAQVSYTVGFLAADPVLRLQTAAQAAGVRAWVIEPRSDATRRAQAHPMTLTGLAGSDLDGASVALGLALAAWAETGLNFLPHRRWARQRRQRVWARQLALVTGVSGALCFGLMAWLDLIVQAQRHTLRDHQTLTQALTVARNTQQSMALAHQQARAQKQWLQDQEMQQQQTVQWHAALSHANPDLWVSQLRQRDAHWVVQGEALSAAHVQEWLQQLTALSVWGRVPELHQLQFMRSASGTGAWVWHFRIEADLKGVH